MVKGQKLGALEYQKLLSQFRNWPDHQLKMIALVVRHVEWLSEQLKKVSAENSELRQAKLLGELSLKELPPPALPPPPPPKVYCSLEQRIILAFKGGSLEQRWFQLLLKFNNLTLADAEAIFLASQKSLSGSESKPPSSED